MITDSNRRNFLKLFGAGASIVPLIHGAPVMESSAKLIAPPAIEPIEFTPVDVEAFPLCVQAGERYEMVVTFRDPRGNRYVFKARTLITSTRVGTTRVPKFGGGYEHIPTNTTYEWQMEGILYA